MNRKAFTLIELLVVIAIIAILAVVVVLTLNPAELLRQSRDANRVSDMATLASALNLYTTDQSSAPTFSLGNASDTYISIYDTSATSTAGDQCQALNLASLSTSTGQAYQCAPSSTYRNLLTGWIPVNFSNLTSGSPIGNLPVDPINQTSTGLYYAYNTNGSQFEVTSELESSKYKSTYANSPQTPSFPEVISGGTQGVSALYNNSGLVGYWPLNEGSGSSTIDASGNGDAGSWVGASGGTGNTHYTSGKVGTYAGYFDGSTNYVVTGINNLPSGANPRSVFMWVHIPGGLQGAPESYGVASTNENACVLIVASNALTFYNPGGGEWTSSLTVTPNTWQLIGYTYAGGNNITLYVGTQSQTINMGAAINTVVSANTSEIGDIGGSGNSQSFTGYVDDVRIYSRVLSPAEIMALYTAEK